LIFHNYAAVYYRPTNTLIVQSSQIHRNHILLLYSLLIELSSYCTARVVHTALQKCCIITITAYDYELVVVIVKANSRYSKPFNVT